MLNVEVTNVTVTADATYQCNLAWHFHVPTLACIFIAIALAPAPAGRIPKSWVEFTHSLTGRLYDLRGNISRIVVHHVLLYLLTRDQLEVIYKIRWKYWINILLHKPLLLVHRRRLWYCSNLPLLLYWSLIFHGMDHSTVIFYETVQKTLILGPMTVLELVVRFFAPTGFWLFLNSRL